MLEIRRGARCGAKCRRIERASPRGEEEDAYETAADLEPTRVEVSVWNAVARSYLELPSVLACGGTWICERKLLDEQSFDEIERRARDAFELATVEISA